MREKIKLLVKFLRTIVGWFFTTNGIFFTFLTGITIALVASQVDHVIEKQRYLELLEYELRTQIIKTNNIVASYNKDKVIRTQDYFDNQVYLAGLSSGYLLTIKPEVLSKLSSYYQFVPIYNQILQHEYLEMETYTQEWERCIFRNLGKKISNQGSCEREKKSLDEADAFYSSQVVKTWSAGSKDLVEINQQFTPTRERMRSRLLRLFMGDSALKFLK